MDLSKFRDMSTGDDILNIINSTVADASVGYHAHEIKQLNLKIKDTPSEYSILPTKVTAQTWKNALGPININGNTNNNLGSVFGRLIDLLAGNTVNFGSSTNEKYNPVSESNNIIPKFNKEISYNVIGSRTEFVGNKTTENAATYTYEDPVAE